MITQDTKVILKRITKLEKKVDNLDNGYYAYEPIFRLFMGCLLGICIILFEFYFLKF